MKIIRIVVSCLLVVSAVLLAWMCRQSIMTPIEFEEQRAARQAQVIEKLIDIRKAQVEYKNQNGKYAGNIDSLIYFVKYGQLPQISKKGELTDEQLSKGLTEKKALEMIANDMADSASVYGIEDFEDFKENFRRDTSFVSVMQSIFPAGFNADQMKFVPFGNGAVFELDTATMMTKSGLPLPLFEARSHYKVFLDGLNKQEIINICDQAKKLDKYPGLKVGDVVAPNNNAGNWE